MPRYAIGVDLGGTNLRIAAVEEAGRLLEKVTSGVKVALGREHVIAEMTDAIRQLAGKFQGMPLAGIGIGVPGIIDMSTGTVRKSPNLPDWHDYPVRAAIEQRLSTRVVLENDANAAALGEKWLGAARAADSMCMLTLGTGVGGGIVMGGRIWHGMTGMAGEFGHITVDPGGPLCNCGNRGCVEQYASATAIVRLAREAIAGGAPGLGRMASSDPEFSARIVYNLAVQGDRDAQAIFQRVGTALGSVLSDLVNAFNFPMYVIGGGVAGAWDAFSPSMFKELAWRSMVYAATAPAGEERQPAQAAGEAHTAAAQLQPRLPGSKTIVTRALLGSDAGLYGAARVALLAAAPAAAE